MRGARVPEPLILWKKIWTPPSVSTGRGFDPDAASSIRISDGIDGAFRHPSIGLHDEPVEDHSLPARFVRFAEYRKPTSVSTGDVMGFLRPPFNSRPQSMFERAAAGRSITDGAKTRRSGSDNSSAPPEMPHRSRSVSHGAGCLGHRHDHRFDRIEVVSNGYEGFSLS